MSWIIVDTRCGKAVAEVWSERAAKRADAAEGLKAIPVTEWLASLNAVKPDSAGPPERLQKVKQIDGSRLG